MKHLNKILVLVVMSVLFYYSPLKAQENNGTLLDSLSDEDELLDSNLVYQNMHDSLNNKGTWIKVVKSEFIKDVNGNETDLDESAYDDNQVVNVWRPNDVDINWAPYDNNGYWLFTDAGWVWISNYSWGWSCYHYGRWWYYPLYGWVWIPGRTWAANWCYWREYGNYYGWYPYGPRIWWRDHHGYRHHNNHIRTNHTRWVFVNKKDFGGKITKNNVVKKKDLKEIVQNSVRVNQISLNEKGNKYIGPEVSNVSLLTGKKIEPKSLNEAVSISKNEVTKKQINTKQNQSSVKNYNGSKENSNTNTGNNNTGKSKNNGHKKNNNSNNSSTKESNRNSNSSHESTRNNNSTRESGKNSNRSHESTRNGNSNSGNHNSNSNSGSHNSNSNSGSHNSNSNSGSHNSNSNSGSHNSNSNSGRNSSPKSRSNLEQINADNLKVNLNNVSATRNNTVYTAPKVEVRKENNNVQTQQKTEVRKENSTVTKSGNTTNNNNTSSRK
ncbi:MAG: hypothetical protein PHN88_04965 [Ignavibacteria bacterium]|nr:hypothetical protein [Ignavibacteria bacterium]